MQWRHLECGCGFKGYEWQKTWWLNTVVPGERIDEEAYRIGSGEHGFVRAIGDLRTRTLELTVSDQNWRQKWILGKWKPMRVMEKQLTKQVQWQHNRCTLYCRKTQFESLSDNRLFWWRDFFRVLKFPRHRMWGGGLAQAVQRLATCWTVRGSNPGGCEIFRTPPGRRWSPPTFIRLLPPCSR